MGKGRAAAAAEDAETAGEGKTKAAATEDAATLENHGAEGAAGEGEKGAAVAAAEDAATFENNGVEGMTTAAAAVAAGGAAAAVTLEASNPGTQRCRSCSSLTLPIVEPMDRPAGATAPAASNAAAVGGAAGSDVGAGVPDAAAKPAGVAAATQAADASGPRVAAATAPGAAVSAAPAATPAAATRGVAAATQAADASGPSVAAATAPGAAVSVAAATGVPPPPALAALPMHAELPSPFTAAVTNCSALAAAVPPSRKVKRRHSGPANTCSSTSAASSSSDGRGRASSNGCGRANIEPLAYQVSEADREAVRNHQGSWAELDNMVRSWLHAALNRAQTADGRVYTSWCNCKQDKLGRLQMSFLKHWVEDPSCGFVTLFERQLHSTAQETTGRWTVRTRAQVLRMYGGDEKTAQKVLNSARSTQPHPQDPTGVDPDMLLYEVFEAYDLTRTEQTVQERSITCQGGVQDSVRAEFAQAALDPSHAALSLPPLGAVATAAPPASKKKK